MEKRTVYFNQKQKNKLSAKLQKNSFVRHGFSEWSETWVNKNTDETVILIRG